MIALAPSMHFCSHMVICIHDVSLKQHKGESNIPNQLVSFQWISCLVMGQDESSIMCVFIIEMEKRTFMIQKGGEGKCLVSKLLIFWMKLWQDTRHGAFKMTVLFPVLVANCKVTLETRWGFECQMALMAGSICLGW